MTLPSNPDTAARARRGKARGARIRAEHLTRVSLGELNVTGVIVAAAETHPELGAIRLRKLLLSQPGWGEHKVNQALQRFERLGIGPLPQPNRLTIGWLLDGRSNGRRWRAWLDAIECVADTLNGTGFPYRTRAEA